MAENNVAGKIYGYYKTSEGTWSYVQEKIIEGSKDLNNKDIFLLAIAVGMEKISKLTKEEYENHSTFSSNGIRTEAFSSDTDNALLMSCHYAVTNDLYSLSDLRQRRLIACKYADIEVKELFDLAKKEQMGLHRCLSEKLEKLIAEK